MSVTSDFLVLSPHTTEALDACFEEVRRRGTASGDYLEFGVFQGHSLLHAYRLAERMGMAEMRFFGWDSFSGLPPPTEADDAPLHELAGVDRLAEGMFAASREGVLARLRHHGVDPGRVHLVEGYFHETLVPAAREALGLREAAVVLVDCDLYASARDVLAFVEPLLREGTVLVMDDYNIFGGDPAKGERLAVAELLARRPDLRLEPLVPVGWHGEAFVLHQDGGA